jgi:hypothetical protein
MVLKFGEAAEPVIDEVRQISDIDVLWLVKVSIESATTIDDVRRVWSSF